jgi:uncharacterized protein YggE
MKKISFVLVAIVALLSVSLFGGVAPAQAQGGGYTITVNGIGTASGQPDIATVEIGYQTLNGNLVNGYNDTQRAVGAFVTAIKDAGVAETDIQLMTSTINPEDRAAGAAGPTGNFFYRFTTVMRVTIRDVSKVDAIIGAAVANSANIIRNFAFAIDKVDALESQARAEAVKNARARADLLAQSIGVSVGDALTINEVVTVGTVLPTGNGSRGAVVQDGTVGGNVGQLIVTVQVQVTFTLRVMN